MLLQVANSIRNEEVRERALSPAGRARLQAQRAKRLAAVRGRRSPRAAQQGLASPRGSAQLQQVRARAADAARSAASAASVAVSSLSQRLRTLLE